MRISAGGKHDRNFDRLLSPASAMSAPSIPSVRLHGANARSTHHPSTNSIPMASPNSREKPPPPLPPPRRLVLEQGEDLGWKYGNRTTPTSPHASVKPGSSLLGSSQKEFASAWSPPYDYHHDSRRGSTVSTVTPVDPAMIMDGLEHASDDDRGTGNRPSLSRYAQ